MRRLIVILLILCIAPALFAQAEKTGTAAHGTEGATHAPAQQHDEAAASEGHHEKTYFGIPGWILKTANMILFIGVLVYFAGEPAASMMARAYGRANLRIMRSPLREDSR